MNDTAKFIIIVIVLLSISGGVERRDTDSNTSNSNYNNTISSSYNNTSNQGINTISKIYPECEKILSVSNTDPSKYDSYNICIQQHY